jgi:hypothetical protein
MWLNYDLTADSLRCALNCLFQDFMAYANNNRLYITPYNRASKTPPYFFEVISMQHVPSKTKHGTVFIRRQTGVRWFVPFEDIFYEVPFEHLEPCGVEQQGFPILQMWKCEETKSHSTQLFVRLHHRHYGAELKARRGCEVCSAEKVYKKAEEEFYAWLGLGKAVGERETGLGDEITWESIMLSRMGLTGDEPIVDF